MIMISQISFQTDLELQTLLQKLRTSSIKDLSLGYLSKSTRKLDVLLWSRLPFSLQTASLSGFIACQIVKSIIVASKKNSFEIDAYLGKVAKITEIIITYLPLKWREVSLEFWLNQLFSIDKEFNRDEHQMEQLAIENGKPWTINDILNLISPDEVKAQIEKLLNDIIELDVLFNNFKKVEQEKDKKNIILGLSKFGDFWSNVDKNLITSNKSQSPIVLTYALMFYNAGLAVLKNAQEEIVDRYALKEHLVAKIKLVEKLLLVVTGCCKIENVSWEKDEENQEKLQEIRLNFDKKLNTILVTSTENEQDLLYRSESLKILLKLLADDIKEFFSELVYQCIYVLGSAPCSYSFIGFGSLEKQSYTPYSDLEFGILIEEGKDNEENRKYFRNLSHLLQAKIINLGETPIPFSLFKYSFDDLTGMGFCFDLGGKTPLGRYYDDKTSGDKYGQLKYELIGSPNHLVQYLEDKWFEVDKLLPMEIGHCTHICGNNDLTKKYQSLAHTKLFVQEQQLIILIADLEKYDTKLGDQSQEGKLYDIKKEIYRLPNIIIEGFAIYYSLCSENNYDKIDELLKNRYITEKAANNLKIALGIAIELRLRTYLSYKNQDERMASTPAVSLEHKESKENLNSKIFMVPNLQILFRFYYRVLPLYEVAVKFCEADDKKQFLMQNDFLDNSEKNKAIICKKLLLIEPAKKWFLEATKKNQQDFESFNYLSIICTELGEYKISEQYLMKAEQLCLTTANKFLMKIYHNYGNLYLKLGDFTKANTYFTKSIENLGAVSAKNLKLLQYQKSKMLHSIGLLKFEESKFEESQSNLIEALNILKNSEIDYLYDTMLILNNLGRVCWRLGKYTEAIKFFHSVKETTITLYDNQQNPNIILPLHNLACIHQEMCEYDVAEGYFRQGINVSLKVYKWNNPRLASILNDYGVLLDTIGNMSEAKKNYENALNIRKALYKDHYPHHSLVETLNNLAVQGIDDKNYCENVYFKELEKIINLNINNFTILLQIHIYNNFASIYLSLCGKDNTNVIYFNKAENYLVKANLFANQLYNGEVNRLTAAILDNLGILYFRAKKIPEAVQFHTQALEMRQIIYKNNPHGEIANSLDNLGNAISSLLSCEQQRIALKYYFDALTMRKFIYGEKPHRDVINSYNNIGLCFVKMMDKVSSIYYLKQSLKMSESIYFRLNNQHCFIKRGKYNLQTAMNKFNQINQQLFKYKTTDIEQGLRRIVTCGSTNELKQYLEYTSVNINTQDDNLNKGYTALHLAILNSKIETALLLLKYNARYDIKDNSNKTVIDYAMEKKISVFLNAVLKIIYKNYRCDTKECALRIAISTGNNEAVKLLLAFDSDTNRTVGLTNEAAIHQAVRQSCKSYPS